jgi:hypothetical protein
VRRLFAWLGSLSPGLYLLPYIMAIVISVLSYCFIQDHLYYPYMNYKDARRREAMNLRIALTKSFWDSGFSTSSAT